MTESFSCAKFGSDIPPGGSLPQQVCGIVQRVDLVSREVEVRVAAETVLFDVPVDCQVVLHGERIKLRLVQSGDQVAITFFKRPNSLSARRLDVQPAWPSSSMA